MALPRVMLLDLDDTIVSFTAGSRDFWREAYEAHRELLTGVPADEFLAEIRAFAAVFWSDPERAATGRLDLVRARREVVHGALGRLGIPGSVSHEKIADFFTEQKEAAVAPFPGAVEALSGFRERGARLGLVSNGGSEFQRRKLRRYDLERFFDAIVIEGELGVGKPDPRVFEEALARLGASTTETWMVGDNLEMDIRGAQQVGIMAVWIDNYGKGGRSDIGVRPDRIITNLGELLQ